MTYLPLAQASTLTKSLLHILIVGEDLGRSPLEDCLEQISRWDLSWRSQPFVTPLEPADLIILFCPEALTEIWLDQSLALALPVVVVTAAPLPKQPGLIAIPPGELSPLTLELGFRAVLQEKASDLVLQPAPRPLETHLQLTTILVKFSQALFRPEATLDKALGILGRHLQMERITIFQWHWDGAGQINSPPNIVEQWSYDGSPPCQKKVAEFPLHWWQQLLELGDVVAIAHQHQDPKLVPLLEFLDVKAFLGLPIFDHQGHHWGHLIFTSEVARAHPWSALEIQALKMAAELLHHNLIRTATQRELEASEALYAGIVTHSAEAIFLIRVHRAIAITAAAPVDLTELVTEFTFEMVNPTYCEKMGVYPRQIIGKSPQTVFPEKLAQQLCDSFQGCLEIGETLLFEEVIELPDCTQIWRTCLIPIRDRQGTIQQIQGSARDVTEERQLELTKMRYSRHQHMLASLTVKILRSWDMDKMLTTTVQELRKTLQADRVIFWEILNETEGKVTAEATHPNVRSMLHHRFPLAAFNRGDFDLFRQGELQTCIDVEAAKFPPAHDAMLREYGVVAYAVLPVLVSAMDDPEGEPRLKGLICVQQCHFPQIWNADELHLLRQLINQICIALNQAELLQRQRHYTNELARSNQELEQFAYVASHDLQEPLQLVANYAQLLARRNGDRLDERSQRYLQHITAGTRTMQTQIQDLLRYSRLNTRQSKPELVSMEDCLQRAIANLKLKLKRTHTQLHCPKTLPEVLGDGSQLQSLWQNLLSNAIKYRGDRQPKITINVTETEHHWQFMVADNGIGIDPKHQQRIFQIFQRLHTQEEYPGTGIGLAICHRIVKIHGGDIWVTSQPQAGATFYFTLPIYHH
ncbi:ATP-binding protein [Synechococcus sp. BDU 130192]|uniref:ATP-binding protein n=1 Tax=Synechococcus sp. BDU 130192 TaxID=2042059 RepID=UPI000C076886|nr:ATP-binding protein [Synechococcus sp. BDU 130192]